MSEMSRLIWRCRRGTRELDLLFGRFLERGYATLSAEQKASFERLLECEDDQLQDWFFNAKRPTDGQLAEIIDIVRRFGTP
jgi:antitoxin CptB